MYKSSHDTQAALLFFLCYTSLTVLPCWETSLAASTLWVWVHPNDWQASSSSCKSGNGTRVEPVHLSCWVHSCTACSLNYKTTSRMRKCIYLCLNVLNYGLYASLLLIFRRIEVNTICYYLDSVCTVCKEAIKKITYIHIFWYVKVRWQWYVYVWLSMTLVLFDSLSLQQLSGTPSRHGNIWTRMKTQHYTLVILLY